MKDLAGFLTVLTSISFFISCENATNASKSNSENAENVNINYDYLESDYGIKNEWIDNDFIGIDFVIFDFQLKKLVKNIGNYELPEDLINDENFIQIINNSEKYYHEVFLVLKSNRFSNYEKTNTIICMSTLPLEKYIEFLKINYYYYFKKGRINKGELLTIVFNDGFGVGNKPILDNYQNQEIVKILNDILNDNEIPEKYKLQIGNLIKKGNIFED